MVPRISLSGAQWYPVPSVPAPIFQLLICQCPRNRTQCSQPGLVILRHSENIASWIPDPIHPLSFLCSQFSHGFLRSARCRHSFPHKALHDLTQAFSSLLTPVTTFGFPSSTLLFLLGFHTCTPSPWSHLLSDSCLSYATIPFIYSTSQPQVPVQRSFCEVFWVFLAPRTL